MIGAFRSSQSPGERRICRNSSNLSGRRQIHLLSSIPITTTPSLFLPVEGKAPRGQTVRLRILSSSHCIMKRLTGKAFLYHAFCVALVPIIMTSTTTAFRPIILPNDNLRDSRQIRPQQREKVIDPTFMLNLAPNDYIDLEKRSTASTRATVASTDSSSSIVSDISLDHKSLQQTLVRNSSSYSYPVLECSDYHAMIQVPLSNTSVLFSVYPTRTLECRFFDSFVGYSTPSLDCGTPWMLVRRIGEHARGVCEECRDGSRCR
jgi:hypothetical protein